jgi:hypothetical protein
MLIDVESSEDTTVINKEAEKILKHRDFIIEIKSMWNVKTKSDISNNMGDWDHFSFSQTVSEQRTGKARN